MRASLILLAACHLSARGIPDGAGDPAEAGADTSVDVPSCYGTSIFRACVMPTGTLTLNGTSTRTPTRSAPSPGKPPDRMSV